MLLQSNKVKRITASGGGTLAAAAGKSLLVKRIECVASTNDTYLTASIDRVTCGFYRVKGRAGNHIAPLIATYLSKHIMDFLTNRGINVFLPIAEGQTLTLSRYAETGNVIITYDEYEAGDITNIMPNGSKANEFTFLQYMSTSQTPTASQSVDLDTSLSPSEFPDFPAGKSVPAKHKITLLGLVGCPFTTGAAGPNAWGTSFLKLIKDREVLFDEDRNGLPFDGQDATATADAYGCNFSVVGPCVPSLINTSVKPWGDPLMLDPALVFDPGAELNIQLTGVMTTAAAWEETMVDFACILKVERES